MNNKLTVDRLAPTFKCTKCKTALEPIDTSDDDDWEDNRISFEKYPCPKCGKYSLYEDREACVLWD